MPDGVTCDNSEFMNFATDLDHVPDGAGRRVVQAVEISARNIKDDWRESWRGSPGLPGAERSITYDLHGTAATTGALAGAAHGSDSAVSAEIGPDLNIAQGAVVGLPEMGTPHMAPRGFGALALANELAGFEAGLAKAVGDPL